MQDATNADLLEEARQLREALRLCNEDKKSVLDYVKRRQK